VGITSLHALVRSVNANDASKEGVCIHSPKVVGGGDVYLKMMAIGRIQNVNMTWTEDVELSPLDTDGDGVTDGDEIAAGNDPFAIDLDVLGCTYFGACNYDIEADVEDGSCLFPPIGCPWPDNSAFVGCT
jgi:hypothetical protein